MEDNYLVEYILNLLLPIEEEKLNMVKEKLEEEYGITLEWTEEILWGPYNTYKETGNKVLKSRKLHTQKEKYKVFKRLNKVESSMLEISEVLKVPYEVVRMWRKHKIEKSERNNLIRNYRRRIN